MNKNHITGLMIQYYFTCHRELWFFANHINMNYEDENIEIGRQIQRDSYDGRTKNVLIDGTIAIDFIEGKDLISEVKKSSVLDEPKEMQLKYYLWYMKNKKGLEVDGVLRYPEERKKVDVSLSDRDIKKIERAREEIPKIISRSTPPKRKEKPFCENCSYFDLCTV